MQKLQEDKDKWLSAMTLYQFRDDGRLGLEVTDPNNSEVGIEQPLLASYREDLHKPFFSQKLQEAGEVELPAKLRWTSSEDAEGVEMDIHIENNPHFAELYFNGPLCDTNLIMEFGGWWFYKAPGVKFVDLMSWFFEHKITLPVEMKLRIFMPPKDGVNDADSLDNYYAVLPALPEVRIEYEPLGV